MPEASPDRPDRDSLLARALAEYLDLRASQEWVDCETFCARFPELAPDLSADIEAMETIDTALEPPGTAAFGEGINDGLPERLSGYRILGEIGSGGMGRVLLAFDEGLSRKVAIKVLSRRCDPQLRARFLAEARAMALVSHPNIARIYSLGHPGEEPHFVMEFVEGVPLTEAARPLSFRQKAELMRKVALAVDYLHKREIIHRDLKPANILVGPDLEPKVLDFGLARPAAGRAGRLTAVGELLGTPVYFSPEQARGDDLDARSDVFSLGTVFYEVLTDNLPFHADTLAARPDPHGLRARLVQAAL